eukprot:scaffold3181_cov167-Amphora_coffeaeformis.AAC.11
MLQRKEVAKKFNRQGLYKFQELFQQCPIEMLDKPTKRAVCCAVLHYTDLFTHLDIEQQHKLGIVSIGNGIQHVQQDTQKCFAGSHA